MVIGIAKYPVFGGSIDQRKLCARRPIRQIDNGAGQVPLWATLIVKTIFKSCGPFHGLLIPLAEFVD